MTIKNCDVLVNVRNFTTNLCQDSDTIDLDVFFRRVGCTYDDDKFDMSVLVVRLGSVDDTNR